MTSTTPSEDLISPRHVTPGLACAWTYLPFQDPIREALSFCEPLFSMSILGFGLWALSGPFPLSAHLGLYKRGRDPPTNPSHHLKKKRSVFALKWLLKEDQGRIPTAAFAAAIATPSPRAADVPASETAASPCLDHRLSPRTIILKPPPPPNSCVTFLLPLRIPTPDLPLLPLPISAFLDFPSFFPDSRIPPPLSRISPSLFPTNTPSGLFPLPDFPSSTHQLSSPPLLPVSAISYSPLSPTVPLHFDQPRILRLFPQPRILSLSLIPLPSPSSRSSSPSIPSFPNRAIHAFALPLHVHTPFSSPKSPTTPWAKSESRSTAPNHDSLSLSSSWNYLHFRDLQLPRLLYSSLQLPLPPVMPDRV